MADAKNNVLGVENNYLNNRRFLCKMSLMRYLELIHIWLNKVCPLWRTHN